MAKMKLDKLIDQCPYNQKDISNYTGINKNTISKYVNNTFEKIDKGHLDLLCDFFKCTPNDLFELEPVQQKMFPPSEIGNWMDISKTNAVGHEYNKTSASQPDIQIMDSNGNISLYEVKSPISGRKIIEENKQFQQKYGYDRMSTEEEILNLQYMQERFDFEHTLSKNLFLITDYIIDNADTSKFHDTLISDIKKYKSMSNSIEASRFVFIYRILCIIIISQMYDINLLNFINTIKEIYSNSVFFNISDDKLNKLLNESNVILEQLNNNFIKKD